MVSALAIMIYLAVKLKLSLSSTDMDYPYCYSFTIPTIGATYYSCASTAYSKFVSFLTTFAGENDGRTWSKVYASGSSTAISVPGNTAPIPGSGSTATPVSEPTPSPSKTSKSAPIGAIVGGVVGGLAIIALAAGCLIFLCLRRRKPKNVAPVAASSVAATGSAPVQGLAPNMTEQQAPQSMYGVPAGYQTQQDGSAAGYYNGGKQDYPPNVQQGGYDAGTMAKFGGPQVNQQEIKPPTSPAPPYSQPVPQQNMMQPMGGVQSIGGPPGMGMGSTGGPPQMMPHNDVQELPAQFATTMHNAQGDPIFEAPDQTYRSA